MSEYFWDSKIEYLRKTRDLYYNDDYLEFLVQSVWKIEQPVHLVDFGCGYGYLGLKLLPLLPKGSTYTGIDKGRELIAAAKELFQDLPYETNFIEGDVDEIKLEGSYDIAMCHALLLHISKPEEILHKMIDCVRNAGRVICFEPHWISTMSNYYLDGVEQSAVIKLGILQKIYEDNKKRDGRDGNIGIKLPMYLSALGVQEIQCRVSDKVNFLDPQASLAYKETLYHSLKEDGVGRAPQDPKVFLQSLVNRGLTAEEAELQYEAEALFSDVFNVHSALTYAPNMKITFGRVYK